MASIVGQSIILKCGTANPKIHIASRPAGAIPTGLEAVLKQTKGITQMTYYGRYYQDGSYVLYIPGTGMGPDVSMSYWMIPGTYIDIE
jgi:hypothetical protein